jgi:hypothetical protein
MLFLASDDSSYINAVEPMVDGGLTSPLFGAFFAADTEYFPGQPRAAGR